MKGVLDRQALSGLWAEQLRKVLGALSLNWSGPYCLGVHQLPVLCDSFQEVLEVRLPGATGDDTDTDLEYEILDGAGEHRHTLGSLQPLSS